MTQLDDDAAAVAAVEHRDSSSPFTSVVMLITMAAHPALGKYSQSGRIELNCRQGIWASFCFFPDSDSVYVRMLMWV